MVCFLGSSILTGYSSPIGIGLPALGQPSAAQKWVDGSRPSSCLMRARSIAVWFLFFPDIGFLLAQGAENCPSVWANSEYGLTEDVSRDDQTEDLAGALVDLGNLGVAEELFDRVLAGVAVAAQHLDRGVGAEHGRLRRGQLGHASFL